MGINCCVLISNIEAFLRDHQGGLIFVSNFDEFQKASNFYRITMKIGIGNISKPVHTCMNTV